MSILDHKVNRIPYPFLIVCEGYGDARFIDALLGAANIVNCSVGCPSTTGGTGSGKDGIAKYLKAIQAVVQSGKAELQGLLVIADADGNAATSFNTMVAAMQAAAFNAPAAPFTLSGAPLRTGLFLIPGQGLTGCLDHILWDAAIQQNPALTQCVTDFFNCTGNRIAAAIPNNQAKMRMSAIAAAHCVDNPWTSAALMWSDAGNPIPANSPRFNDLVQFLQQFVQ